MLFDMHFVHQPPQEAATSLTLTLQCAIMHCWSACCSFHALMLTADVLLLHGMLCMSAARDIDIRECISNDQPAVQTATGRLNDTSAATALDAARLSFNVYTNITQDALAAVIVSAQGPSSAGRRCVTLPLAEATIGGKTASLSHLPFHHRADHRKRPSIPGSCAGRPARSHHDQLCCIPGDALVVSAANNS
jgi:hypothetical protein